MHLSVDLGASTIDLVEWDDQSVYQVLGSYEYSKEDFESFDLRTFLVSKSVDLSTFENIYVTGGKTRLLNDVDFICVNEIDAIGRGGALLSMKHFEKPFVVASLGTGTCLVHVDEKGNRHIGGTGVGGGTFLALSKQLFGVTDISELESLYKEGVKEKVDLSVQEIVGGGIGVVSGDVTASNLGKIAREVDFSKEDLAAGVVNLIGQTIATASCFAAKSVDCNRLVLTGKLAKIDAIVEVIRRTAAVYNIDVFVPKDGLYVSAIGAGVK